jgi:hypothetical protein
MDDRMHYWRKGATLREALKEKKRKEMEIVGEGDLYMIHAHRLQAVIDSPEMMIVQHLQHDRNSHILLEASLEDCSSVFICPS